MATQKPRLDELLVARGFCGDLREAAALVMGGDVLVEDRVETKPGTRLHPTVGLRLRREARRWASRAGEKLARGLDAFAIDVRGKVVLDAGASAGGFTDCLLQRGARRVFAVDVGYGQMDGRLTNDPRVVALERTNISDLAPSTFGADAPELCTVDLSYLSLLKAVPALASALPPAASFVCLVKPLYEGLGQDEGRDLVALARVLRALLPALDSLAGRRVTGLVASPVLGGRGVVELLVHLAPSGVLDLERAIATAIAEAASVLGA